MTQPSKLVLFPGGKAPAGAPKPTRSYNLDPRFEADVAYLAATRPTFWPSLRGFLDPEAIVGSAAKLALQAVKQLAEQSSDGRGPSSMAVVLQRLRAWMTDGKVTKAQIDEVYEALTGAEDRGVSNETEVLAELGAMLRRRAELDAVDAMAQQLAKGGDVLAPVAVIERARLIGELEDAAGRTFTDDPLDSAVLASLRSVDRLAFNVPELDGALDGGLACSTLTTLLADSNAGKSQALVHVAVAARFQGHHVAYATLEMPCSDIVTRVQANATGIPYNVIRDDRAGCRVDAEFAAVLGRQAKLGRSFYRQFPAGITRPAEVIGWVSELEREHGIEVRVLVVDYADEMTGGAVSRGGEENTYQSAGNVYTDLFNFAQRGRRWVVTAAQAKRRGRETGAKLGIHDIADSMKKVRKADYVLSLNPEDEDTLMVVYVAKARGSKRGATVGPLATDFAASRIFPVAW